MQQTRAIMQQGTEQQSQLAYACNQRKVEIQEILKFFGQEIVARVVKESPKLHEPPA
jgi:membrane-bound inhibitor of C-type lysozyme